MTCGDFHDGSKKGTVSVHQILCQSWEKCYRDPHNDSTSLQGPKLESCTGVSMACHVQDWSHISWRWQTHRETQKLHNSWNCCTNSRAHPSGSMLDHSRNCWGGRNLLWDIPTGSDGRIWHAPYRSQICAQDFDSWPEAAARQRLHWTLSACVQWWNLFVQGHHWWWKLGLQLRPWDKATILSVEMPHITKAKKDETGGKQCQEHDHHFLWRQGDCEKRICPNRSNCEFWVLLQYFMSTVWKRAKTLLQTLARTDLAASPWQRPVSHFRPHPAVSGEKQNGCHPPPTILPQFGTLWLLYPKMKLKLKGRQFDTIEEIQAKSQSTWHSDRKGLPGSVPKMEEMVGRVSTYGRELPQGWWVMAANRSYGEFYDFYSVSPENFGYQPVLHLHLCLLGSLSQLLAGSISNKHTFHSANNSLFSVAILKHFYTRAIRSTHHPTWFLCSPGSTSNTHIFHSNCHHTLLSSSAWPRLMPDSSVLVMLFLFPPVFTTNHWLSPSLWDSPNY